MAAAFMPVCREDLEARGIDQLDFVYINGDAYVDHPTFGVAIITRVLEHAGFTVGVLAQPDWHRPESFLALGKPRYAFLVSAGNIDSMVAHYTKKSNCSDRSAHQPQAPSDAAYPAGRHRPYQKIRARKSLYCLFQKGHNNQPEHTQANQPPDSCQPHSVWQIRKSRFRCRIK